MIMRAARWFAVSLAAAAVAPAGAAAQTCDSTTSPQFRGEVPTAEQVLGFPIGARDVTTDEAYRYMDAVDVASPRVITGSAGRSVQGRELRYAIVGHGDNLTPAGLERIRAAARELRDPATSPARAAEIAASTPAILWIASNVHGNEESGTDASLRVLHELADRDDCAARQILDASIVVLLPIQNPDGREADARRNAYGFDLNRDWFARTQPETDTKIELMRSLPPVLFVDDHEMGAKDFFFPPNADPVYHEITDEAIGWINGIYGRSLQEEFGRRGIRYFNYSFYDLFYMGYGDTVPSTGFIAAGMTYEKHHGDSTSVRAFEQYVAQWTTLSSAAREKQRILAEYNAAWREALRQGQEGALEPNQIIAPDNAVQRPVPDIRVRHYFLDAKDPQRRTEVAELVRRLQRMDVAVYRLKSALRVPDFTPYGRRTRERQLPAGTYWIPMAQPQKHWVQAMLNEDTYVPFPYFYDVTAWSQPLLFNVEGGYSGADLRPSAAPVETIEPSPSVAARERAPSVAVLQLDGASSSAVESTGWLRYLLEREWRLPYRLLTPADVAAGALAGTDVLLVPNGRASSAFGALGETGRSRLAEWTRAGGRYVGWRGGTELAAQLGLTSARLSEPTSDIPGSLLRVLLDRTSPLAAGVGTTAYALYAYDRVMRAGHPSHVAVRFPRHGSEDFFVSGFAEGEEQLSETAAVIAEPFGSGSVVLFSFEPNFRAFTDGTQRILRNAVLGREPARVPAGARAASAARAQAVRAAARLDRAAAPLRLTVKRRGAHEAAALLRRSGARWRTRRADGEVTFLIANPRQLTGDEHPFARRLSSALLQSRVPVVAFRVP